MYVCVPGGGACTYVYTAVVSEEVRVRMYVCVPDSRSIRGGACTYVCLCSRAGGGSAGGCILYA